MRRWVLVFAMLGLGSLGATQAPPAKAPAAATATQAVRMRSVRLHIFHRAFPNFHDQTDAVIGKEFPIGDTDYSGTVTQFLPDFDYDVKTHRARSKSPEPRNPAFNIVVRRKGTPTDTTWAFLNLPPHFSKQSLIAFIATEVTLTNGTTLVSRDSLALQIRAKEGR